MEEDWKKLKSKRDVPDNHGGGRRRKKLKLDEESQKEDNPRYQGLQKRKPQFETEFERECKKLRPEFDIDRELLFNSSPDDVRHTAVKYSKPPKKFFDIFEKKATTKSNLKQKIAIPKPKKIQLKKSLTPNTAQKDIRTFFDPNREYEASKLPFYSAAQLPIISEGKTINPKVQGEVRARESELGNWDPGVHKEHQEV